MVTSYAFDLLTLVELLFYLFILLFLFIVITGILNKNGNRVLILRSAVISVGLALLVFLGSYWCSEGDIGFFILGLPLTLPLEPVGKIQAKYGYTFWMLTCAVLYAINTFTVLSTLLLIIRWIKKGMKNDSVSFSSDKKSNN